MMKHIGIVGALLICVGLASAETDTRVFSASIVSNTATTIGPVVVRGALEAVRVDVAAGATCTVVVASSELTLFSKASITADATYMVRMPCHLYTGAAATFNTYSATNMAAGVMAANAQAWLDKPPMAGPVTVTVTPTNPSGTKTYTVTLIYSK